jgi:hypothetical protein
MTFSDEEPSGLSHVQHSLNQLQVGAVDKYRTIQVTPAFGRLFGQQVFPERLTTGNLAGTGNFKCFFSP